MEQSAGKHEWVRQALTDHQKGLLHYANRLLGDEERAADVVQETYLKLWKQEPNVIGTGVKAWLYTVCRNQAFDVLRKEGRTVSFEAASANLHDQGPSPMEILENHERNHLLQRFMSQLPANQREVLQLKFQAGLSYKEISEVTKHSVSHVGVLLHQALKVLRTQVSHGQQGARGGVR